MLQICTVLFNVSSVYQVAYIYMYMSMRVCDTHPLQMAFTGISGVES